MIIITNTNDSGNTCNVNNKCIIEPGTVNINRNEVIKMKLIGCSSTYIGIEIRQNSSQSDSYRVIAGTE